MNPSPFIAGQITCRECGHVELLIRRTSGPWARVRRCHECDSRFTSVPVWWPVEDKKAISAAMSAEHHREAIALTARKAMH